MPRVARELQAFFIESDGIFPAPRPGQWIVASRRPLWIRARRALGGGKGVFPSVAVRARSFERPAFWDNLAPHPERSGDGDDPLPHQ
jgi:hypothetical protein